MATWLGRRAALLITIFVVLSLLAPVATSVGAEEAVPPLDESVGAEEPFANDVETPEMPPAPSAAPGGSEGSPAVTEEAPAQDESVIGPAPPAAEFASPPVEQTGTSDPPASAAAVAGTTDTPNADDTAGEVGALAEASTLTLTVTDSATAVPIAGATVIVYDQGSAVVATGTTDDAGVFVAASLVEALYAIEVSAEGYQTGYDYPWVSGPTTYWMALTPLPSPGVVTVHVLDSVSGEPIAGATVIVRDDWGGGVEMTRGTTGSDGTFLTDTLPVSEYSIEASAESYLTGYNYAYVTGPMATTVWLQRAPLPGTLTIRAVDQATGAPVAGASVVVRDPTSQSEVATGATDGSGTFSTAELAPGEYAVDVEADGYYPAHANPWVNGPTEYAFALEKAPLPGTVTVHVVDQLTGDPLAGATVVVLDARWSELLTSITDDSGTFTTPELPGGQYYVDVRADQYSPGAAYPAPFVDGPVETTVALAPILPGTLTVYAVNQETGAQIAGATVIVRDYWSGGLEVATGATDADGAFVTPELPAGDYTVEVSADHHITGYAAVTINGPFETTVALIARFPGSISLTVIDRVTGEPIAGATVEVEIDPLAPKFATGTTDESGVFVTPELPGGNTWISVIQQGYWGGYTYRWLNGSTEVTLELERLDAGDLTVTVVDETTGSPIAGASVVVRDHFSGADVVTGSTDADGIVVFSALPGGTYDIDATAEGYFSGTSPATVNGPNQASVALWPRVAGTLTVSVQDLLSGPPIANASVTVVDSASGDVVASGTTNASGTFVTDTLPGGWYDVSVTALGFEPGETSMRLTGPGDVWIPLQPVAGQLTVQIVDQVSGAPVAGAAVSVRGVWEEVAAGATDAAGTFVTGELPPGDYYVEVTVDGYFSGSDWAHVRGESVFVLELDPRVAGTLTVTVVDQSTGKPIGGALVTVSGGGAFAAGLTGNKGVYTTGTLPGDYYRIDATADGYRLGSAFPLVSGPTTATVSLESTLPGTLTVRVIDSETGGPIAGARIEVREYRTPMIVASGVTKKSGEFRTKDLPEGYYDVAVTAEGYFATVWDTRIEGDGELQVSLLRRAPGTLTVMTRIWGSDDPIPGADVVVYERGSMAEVAAGKSDADGLFVTATLKGGDYFVRVTADGYIASGYEFVRLTGDAELVANLEPGLPGTLTTTVVDENTGQPIAGATVLVRESWESDTAVATGITDAEGRFVTAELPAWGYYVSAVADGYLMTDLPWVRVDGPAELRLTMVGGEPGTVQVSVIDRSNRDPVAGATVVVRNGVGTEVDRGITDGEGVFVSPQLPAGGYRVDVSAVGHESIQNHYTVVDGPAEFTLWMALRVEATLVLSPAAGTPGTKVTMNGNGFESGERVRISWQNLDGSVLGTVTTKKDGTFSLTGVSIPDIAAGRYRIVAIGLDSEGVAVADVTVTTPTAAASPDRPGGSGRSRNPHLGPSPL